MKVLKFGGTSMGSVESLVLIAKIIKENLDNSVQMIIACSAMSGVTNNLIEIGHLAENNNEESAIDLYNNIKNRHFETAEALGIKSEFEKQTTHLFQDLQNLIRGISLIREFSERSNAYLQSFGERFSTRLLTAYLNKLNINARQFDSGFIKTQGINFTVDEIDWEKTIDETNKILSQSIEKNEIPIVTGFFGTNKQGVISLIGRGGSDLTGAVLTVCMGWKTLEIWTDVDGFLTADPRIVKNARIIDEIGFQEASELCFFGAKVLHPKTIRPVIDLDGEVWIKNTFNANNPGTRIKRKAEENKYAVISISSKKSAWYLWIYSLHRKTENRYFQTCLFWLNNKIFPSI
ncbi:MAG: aspartate kinase [Saprospiraceae bacterium]